MADSILADVDASGIYQIRNKENGKVYIGSAKSFKIRWAKHRNDLVRGKHHSAYLQRSWNLYGEAAFAFEVIELCDQPALIQREQYWMDELRPEYNVSPTAGNCLGVKHSAETKLKHTLAMTGRKFPEAAAKRVGQKRTPEQRERMSAAQKIARANWSPEAVASLAESIRRRQTGKKQSPEHIARRSAGLMGHAVSAETRAKLSAANKGRKPSAKCLAAALNANKGVKRSEEILAKLRGRKLTAAHKAILSAANTGRGKSIETRMKLSAAMKGKKLSPEAIAKRTASRYGRAFLAPHQTGNESRGDLDATLCPKLISGE